MTQLPGCTNPAHSGGFGHYCGAACTPPVENSNPSGASEGADGQGVCIPRGTVKPWLRAHDMAVQCAEEVLRWRRVAAEARVRNDLAAYESARRVARECEATVRCYAADALWTAQS